MMIKKKVKDENYKSPYVVNDLKDDNEDLVDENNLDEIVS